MRVLCHPNALLNLLCDPGASQGPETVATMLAQIRWELQQSGAGQAGSPPCPTNRCTVPSAPGSVAVPMSQPGELAATADSPKEAAPAAPGLGGGGGHAAAAPQVARVFTRPIFRARPDTPNPLHGVIVAAFAGLWGISNRLWENWVLPPESLFEVGMLVDL